jgi:5-bromo-4-chloroindolyl phosphate hydrolysis protein
MNDFLQMDIFFVVTTAAVVVITILFALALFYVVRVLRNVDQVMRNISEESGLIREDIAVLRTNVRTEGMKWKHFARFFGSFAGRSSTPRSSRKRAPNSKSEADPSS